MRPICKTTLAEIGSLLDVDSKTQISVMWCGNATGDLLPPMVVYKAQNSYQSWEEGGPTGTVYAATKKGWFDSYTFEVWFVEVFLPYVADLEGPKVLLGDNLASHFSERSVEYAARSNIHFIMLPPNATHLMQPLDVAVFSSTKRSWREVLNVYKRETRLIGAFNKKYFPMLLTRLWNAQKDRVKQNLVAGFRATGLWPVDRRIPSSRLPDVSMISEADSVESMNDTLIDLLKTHRGIRQPKRAR